MYVCMYVCVYVCMHVCMRVYVYICKFSCCSIAIGGLQGCTQGVLTMAHVMVWWYLEVQETSGENLQKGPAL